MKRNQKGFSLIELIVVIAVMGILSVTGLLSLSLVTGQNIKGCVSDIESCISETKVQSMSRANAGLMLYAKSDGIYARLYVGTKEPRELTAAEWESVEEQKIGKRGISISFKTDGGGEIPLQEGGSLLDNSLILSFDRSSGAFKTLRQGTVSGVTINAGEYCTAIILESGQRSMQITLIPQTGKYYTED